MQMASGKARGCWDTGYGALMAVASCRGLLGCWLVLGQKSKKAVGSGRELEEKFRALDIRASQIVVKG